MLVLRIIEDAMIKRGFTGELSMTLENNHLINRFLAAIGDQIQDLPDLSTFPRLMDKEIQGQNRMPRYVNRQYHSTRVLLVSDYAYRLDVAHSNF